MAKNNKIASLVLLALFGVGLYMAFSFPERSSYFPKIICTCGLILSAILLVKSIGEEKNGSSEKVEPLSPKARKMLVVMGSLIVLYAVGISTLGFGVSTFLFVAISGVILYPQKISKENPKPLILIVISALVTSVLITVVFKVLLYVPLPAGILI